MSKLDVYSYSHSIGSGLQRGEVINVDRIIGPEEPAAPRFGVTSCSENMSIKGNSFGGPLSSQWLRVFE
jgi:hypothetical protein